MKINVKFDYAHACQMYRKLFALYACTYSFPSAVAPLITSSFFFFFFFFLNELLCTVKAKKKKKKNKRKYLTWINIFKVSYTTCILEQLSIKKNVSNYVVTKSCFEELKDLI